MNVFAQNEGVTVINIESAEKSEYKKNENGDQEEIVLQGSVSLSVTKDSTKIAIKADLVTFNRETQILFAQDNVEVIQTTDSEGEQDVKCDTLLLNTSTLEAIFDHGRVSQTQSDAINLPSGSTLIVASQMLGRDSGGTISFKNADLTFCDDENPHWRIKASKVWLLDGGEFAFLNAVLFIGNIPLLYLPAFYYPKDELIFNPSFGYAERKGYYFQTTTYIFGRKAASDTVTSSDDDDDDIASGVFSFIKGSSLKKQVREGLVLHNTDEAYTGDTTNYLKVMADYYSNLGYMLGFDGVYKNSKKGFGISGKAEIGFSNTIYYNSGYYPYDESGNVTQDTSNFMGLQLPFRYGANLELSVSSPFTYTLSLPVYSDPYFYDDFDSRSESLDWIGFLINGATDDTTTTSVSSFSWNSTFSYSVKLSDSIKPYISTLAISSITSALTFTAKENSNATSVYSPNRYFYYPSEVVPLKASGKIAGTLISIGTSKSSSSSKKESVAYTTPLSVPEDLKESTSETKTEVKPEESDTVLEEGDLPKLSNTENPKVTSLSGLTYTLDYSITPTFSSSIAYNSSSINSPEDFQLSKIYSTYYQVTAPVVLTSKLNYADGFISSTNALTFNPVYQEHPNLDGYSETAAATVKTTDYNARKLDLTNTNSISFKPFVYSSVLKNSNLSWNSTIKVIKTEFIGDADDPAWYYGLVDFTDDDYVTKNTLSAQLYAQEGNFSQILTLSSSLPPENQKYDATLKLVFPCVTFNLGGGVEQQDDESWESDDLSQSISFSFLSSKVTLTESFNYDIEDNYASSAKIALKLWNFQLAYVMQYTYGYTCTTSATGRFSWTENDTKEFLPYSINLSYSDSGNTYRFWKNRIVVTPSVDAQIVCDLLKPTSSYLKFIPGLTFKINDFFNLTFASESQNNVIYRYVQGILPSGYPVMGGETNPFVDLYNSFAFWNTSLRKSSGFKLKTLSVSLTHSACDWDFTCQLTFKPRLVTDSDSKKRSYSYDPYLTLAVSWRPLSSVKTEVVDDYGTWELNP